MQLLLLLTFDAIFPPKIKLLLTTNSVAEEGRGGVKGREILCKIEIIIKLLQNKTETKLEEKTIDIKKTEFKMKANRKLF